MGVAPGVGREAAVNTVAGEGDLTERMYEMLLWRFGTEPVPTEDT